MSLPAFGVRRPVPVNLLMAAFLLGGAVCSGLLTREFFPQTNPESATVRLLYPGATPEEIEESLARKVEDKIADLDEVDQLTTSLSEGGGAIMVEFREGVGDVGEAVDEVERAIDTLRDLPDDAERIETTEFEPTLPVIMLSIFGPADEDVMKRSAIRIRDDLRSLPGMGDIVVVGARDYEIRVDVSQDALMEHAISLPEVADVIGAWLRDVPGGNVRTAAGTINVRAIGVEEGAEAIREIVVRAGAAGDAIRVGDIADVREGFVDEPFATRFSTREATGPAVSLTVFKVGDQDAVEMAQAVRAYTAGRTGEPFEPKVIDRVLSLLTAAAKLGEKPDKPATEFKTARRRAYELGASAPDPLPAGCRLGLSSDLARFIEGRLDLLLRNAKWGAMLVFATLLLFLNWRVALWVGVGLATALSGTIMIMYAAGITLNLLTMFGLIIVMGLLVDDAIVVAENIQARHDRGEKSFVAAARGAEQVFWPVVATVLTSIAAFMPLTFIRGQIGDLLGALPYVVTCALVMSLIESVLILPSHMGHSLQHRDDKTPGRVGRVIQRMEGARDRLILDVIVPGYARGLAVAMRWRYVCISAAIAILVGSAGLVAGGRLPFTFLPTSDSETIIIDLAMPVGALLEETTRMMEQLEAAAREQVEMKTINTYIGVRTNVDDTSGATNGGIGTHLGQMFVELLPVEQRDRESTSVIASIRDRFGKPPGVERLNFMEIQGGPGGADITIQITGDDETRVGDVTERVKGLLAKMAGVVDIVDDNSDGQREIQVELKPGAAGLGFTVANVASQVRAALFGLDPHVFSERREDIDVRVRLDSEARASLSTVENLWLVSPTGQRVPLAEIAELVEGASYSAIRRIDRRRAVTVTASTLPGTNPEEIVPALRPDFETLQAQYPDVTIEEGGRQRQLAKAFSSLPIGFLAACVVIYVILAWLFGSYAQPITIMCAIPFGAIGIVWGHVLLGYPLTFLSLIGSVALQGIVVNDSLIFVQFFNEERARGVSLHDSLLAAGRQRLRPIFLTTVTTVLGLTPLMLEQSFQAKFLIPMAIAISFGLMSATVLILVLLPCIILIMDDIKAASFFLWHGATRPDHPAPGTTPGAATLAAAAAESG